MRLALDETVLNELETDLAMKSDPVHLNKPGYQCMAEAVLVLLVEAAVTGSGCIERVRLWSLPKLNEQKARPDPVVVPLPCS
ncbi:MAG TPA: hypothetical protein DCF62_13390 [Porticoccaceae bacterium]|nr:hypothetical protein [Porticoccaceae bacterium]